MKTVNKTLIISLFATAVAGAGITTLTIADDGRRGGYEHHDEHYGKHGKHGKRARGGKQRFEQLLERYDANADGVLTMEEISQGRQARLQQFDADGSGQLDLDEFTALWLDGKRDRVVDRFQALDDDGDASVTLAEFQEPVERMAQRLDRNNDGQISDDDMRRGRR